jgi:hypothetical protein
VEHVLIAGRWLTSKHALRTISTAAKFSGFQRAAAKTRRQQFTHSKARPKRQRRPETPPHAQRTLYRDRLPDDVHRVLERLTYVLRCDERGGGCGVSSGRGDGR